MKTCFALITVALLFAISACGGGSSGTSGPGGTTDGTSTDGTSTNGTSTDGTSTDGTTTGGNTIDPNAASGLTHLPVKMPTGNLTPANSNLFSSIGKQQAADISQTRAVVVEVVENSGFRAGINCKSLEAHFAACSVINLHLKDSTGSLNDGNWKIYFHSIRRVLQVNSGEFDIFHVNGDLHYLAPGAEFQGFVNEPIKSIALVTEYNFIHRTDAMPRYWLARDGQAPATLPNTDTTTELDSYMVRITGENRKLESADANPVADSANRFDRFSDTAATASIAQLIIPTPKSTTVGSGTLSIGSGFNFDSTVLASVSRLALNARMSGFYSEGGPVSNVSTAISGHLAANEYRLIINNAGVGISGGTAEAVFNGAQSLLALVTPGSATIPHLDITDSPRFEYRGMHADVARNFQSVRNIKVLIDQMAAYKLNRLHLHLADDEGWRLEIPGLPELTSVGASRKFQVDSDGNVIENTSLMPQLGSGPGTGNQGTGFFSRIQFVDLLRYANARFVKIIPSMDMPAHARAAVVSMRVRAANLGTPGDTAIRLDDPADLSRYLTIQHFDDNIINPCIEGAYNFFQTVVTEVTAMYAEAGAPLDIWHMGGDEANSIFKSTGFQDKSDANKVSWKGDVDQTTQDHPWEKSPACQALISSDSTLNNLEDLNARFIKRVSQIVANAGIEALYGWHDIAADITPEELATTKTGVTYWENVNVNDGGNYGYQLANQGFEVILAVPDFLYFDFAQEADPEERGQYWGARYIDTRKVFSFAPENIPQNAETSLTKLGAPFTSTGSNSSAGFSGIQGQLWSELITAPELFDAMLFPRLLALAERAWHKGSWEENYLAGTTYSNTSNRIDKNALNAEWNNFAHALGKKELAKLDAAGINYRVPTTGSKFSGGSFNMNSEFPGLGIEYKPTAGSNWLPYSASSKPSTVAMVRTRSANGARTGRETPVP